MGRKKKPAAKGFPSLKEIEGNALPEVEGQEDARRDLSLDLSSSCVGWSVGVEGQLVGFGKLVFKTTAEVGEKLEFFVKFLKVLFKAYDPDTLLIEKPLGSRGNTTARHFEMMGIVRWMWRWNNGEELDDDWLITATTVKKWLKVRRGNNHAQNKQIMVNKINSLCQLSLRWHKNSSYKSDDDIADAIAVLITYWRKYGVSDGA